MCYQHELNVKMLLSIESFKQSLNGSVDSHESETTEFMASSIIFTPLNKLYEKMLFIE